MLKSFILVGIGSFLGGGLRFLIATLVKSPCGNFPLGTFLANILGCFILGLIFALVPRESPYYLLFATGFCGGFTTFSTFSLETFTLLQNAKYMQGVFYSLSSLIVGLIFFALAYKLTKLF